jgi:hypothetical protein
MAETRKITRFEIQDPDGTLTDITPDVSSIEIMKAKPSLWQRLVDLWYYRKLRKLMKLSLNVTFSVGVHDVAKTYDPYARYKYDHRN